MEVPSSLAHLVAINVEFKVVLCLSPICRHAQTTSNVVEHIRKTHHEKPAIRKQLKDFLQELTSQDAQFRTCNYTTVHLPADGSSPQLVVPVVDGFSCYQCRFLTTNRAVIRQHANKVHAQKRIRDENMCESVRIQSWFGQKRERYWIVDESKELELGQQLEQGAQEQEQDRQLERERELELELELGQLGRLYNTTAISH